MHARWWLAGAAALALVGCGGSETYDVQGEARVVGADATMKCEEIEGGNAMVTIEAEHLTPPGRLDDGLSVYVAWIRADDRPPRRAAVLAYDAETRVARGRAICPELRFEVFVTAEENGDVETPSRWVVFEKTVDLE